MDIFVRKAKTFHTEYSIYKIHMYYWRVRAGAFAKDISRR